MPILYYSCFTFILFYYYFMSILYYNYFYVRFFFKNGGESKNVNKKLDRCH